MGTYIQNIHSDFELMLNIQYVVTHVHCLITVRIEKNTYRQYKIAL